MLSGRKLSLLELTAAKHTTATSFHRRQYLFHALLFVMKDSYLEFVLFLLLGMGSATRNVRCQGNRVRLECERGNVVKTDLAFYGELEPGKELCKDVSQVLEQCHKDVSDIVKKDCDDKQFCVFAIDRRFKDLCLAKYFYLDIRYSCGEWRICLIFKINRNISFFDKN